MFTAAHCVHEKYTIKPRAINSFYGFIGKYDLKANESGATRGTFNSIRIHPDWDVNNTRYDADIAVLVLKDQIIYGPFIQPACLPAPTTNVFNTRGTIVGYGASETFITTNENRPKFVKIPSVDNEKCLFEHLSFHFFGSYRSFCAGEWGKKACQGDSGGGFYVQNDNVHTVSGIVSAGFPNCSASQYAVFTNVPKFVEWIRQEIAQDVGNEEQGVGVTLDCKFDKYFV
jgi:secreted trypsin-like serine protease